MGPPGIPGSAGPPGPAGRTGLPGPIGNLFLYVTFLCLFFWLTRLCKQSLSLYFLCGCCLVMIVSAWFHLPYTLYLHPDPILFNAFVFAVICPL